MRPVASLIVSACIAASALAGTHPLPLNPAPGQEQAGVTPLVFDPAAYNLLKGADRVTFDDFPIGGGQTVDLDLHPIHILAPGAKIVVASAGRQQEVAPPDQVLLAGDLPEHPGATAFLSLSPLGCNGIIEIDGHRHLLSAGRFGSGLPPVVFDLDTLPEGAINWRDFTCGSDLLKQPPQPARTAKDGGGVADFPCRIAKVAVESDYEYTLNVFGGNTDASAAYALTLMAADSEIYARDINAHFEVSYLRVWADDTDPYSGPSSVDRLSQMQAYWTANMGDVDRTITHMLTAVRGDTGGIAWVGVLCNKTYGYGLSDYIDGYFPYPLVDHDGSNWDLMVTAHEMGHNFGASHTHEMNPPIDGCGNGDCSLAWGGTIMSYCHVCAGGMTNIVLHFHQRTIDENIMPYLKNNKGCKLVRTAPDIFQQPKGATVCPGEKVTFNVIPLGDENPTYQWSKDGVDIDGANAISYTIDSVTPDDEGSYQVSIGNLCGGILSDPAVLDVIICPADLNGDCVLDVFDFLAFQNLFNAGDPRADTDGSGSLDLFDFLTFQNLFADGCH